MNFSKHFNNSVSLFSCEVGMITDTYLARLLSELKTMYAICLNQCLAHSRYSIHVVFVIIMALL